MLLRMYFSNKMKDIFLVVLVLVQIVGISSEVDECPAETNLEEGFSDQTSGEESGQQSDICINDQENHGSDQENGIYLDGEQNHESNQESEICTVKRNHANAKVKALATNSSLLNVTKFHCTMDKVYGPVEIADTNRLMELLILESGPANRTRNDKEGKQLPAMCILVLFYARWCIFSSQAAPHFNALPRSFPHIKVVAINAIKHPGFNAQYGIVGVPTLMLIHNGKPVAKFNNAVYTLDSIAKFIKYLTNLKPNGSLYLTTADFSGPVSSVPSDEIDYCLVLSWIFIGACALYFTSQSRWWKQFVELVQNTWRESNAQHEHVE